VGSPAAVAVDHQMAQAAREIAAAARAAIAALRPARRQRLTRAAAVAVRK